jgi:hypothetical protein
MKLNDADAGIISVTRLTTKASEGWGKLAVGQTRISSFSAAFG